MSAPYYETDSEAEVEAEIMDWREEDVPPPNWKRWEILVNERRTAEEIFGNPAKRRRLQQLARTAMEEEKRIDAVSGPLRSTRKETDDDPLRYVLLFLEQ